LLSSAFMSGRCLFEELFVLRFKTTSPSAIESLSSASALSVLGTVPLLILLMGPAVAFDLVLGRLFGAFVVSLDATDFLCLTPLVTACEAESAASSPEASREDG